MFVRNSKGAGLEQLDSQILPVTIACIQDDESLYFKIKAALPEKCHARFDELWDSVRHCEFAPGSYSISWDEYNDLKEQQHQLRKFIEDHLDLRCYDSIADIGDAVKLSTSAWNEYLKRVGRSNANDKDYCMRLFFILKLNRHEAMRLLEITGQPGPENKDKREFHIWKMLLNGIYDPEVVDGVLLEEGVMPLFLKGIKGDNVKGKVPERIMRLRENEKIINSAKEKLGKERFFKRLNIDEDAWGALWDRLEEQKISEEDRRIYDWIIGNKAKQIEAMFPIDAEYRKTQLREAFILDGKNSKAKTTLKGHNDYIQLRDYILSLAQKELSRKIICKMMGMTEMEFDAFRGRMISGNFHNDKENFKKFSAALELSDEQKNKLYENICAFKDKDTIRNNC